MGGAPHTPCCPENPTNERVVAFPMSRKDFCSIKLRKYALKVDESPVPVSVAGRK